MSRERPSDFPRAVFGLEKCYGSVEVPRSLVKKGVVNHQFIVNNQDELDEKLAEGWKEEQIVAKPKATKKKAKKKVKED